MNLELHPQKALAPRIIYVAIKDDLIIGFIAGHLTERFECDGELEWINVITKERGKGVAPSLILVLAEWFRKQNAFKICVDPGDETARKFYAKNGAEKLNEHWMFWNDISILLKD